MKKMTTCKKYSTPSHNTLPTLHRLDCIMILHEGSIFCMQGYQARFMDMVHCYVDGIIRGTGSGTTVNLALAY